MTDTQEIPADERATARLRFFRDLDPGERMKLWRALVGPDAAAEATSHAREHLLFDRYFWSDRAARSAQPGVVVKPLEWLDDPGNDKDFHTIHASPPLAYYQIWWRGSGPYWLKQSAVHQVSYNTLEEAQAAAQSDYDAHIRSAILDAPDHTALLREALERVTDDLSFVVNHASLHGFYDRCAAGVGIGQRALQSLKAALGDTNGSA